MGKEKIDIDIPAIPESKGVKFADVTLRTLHDLLVSSSGIEEAQAGKAGKEESVRYQTEKKQLIEFLFKSDGKGEADLKKDSKYDYMISFLLYLSSDPKFTYGFGYFKDKLKYFDKVVEKWNSFIRLVIEDIKALPELSFDNKIDIEVNGVMVLTVMKDRLIGMDLNLEALDSLFKIDEKWYRFRILISDIHGKRSVVEAGDSNGKGKDGGLVKGIDNFNKLLDSSKKG